MNALSGLDRSNPGIRMYPRRRFFMAGGGLDLNPKGTQSGELLSYKKERGERKMILWSSARVVKRGALSGQ
jgi:hypothetical protein